MSLLISQGVSRRISVDLSATIGFSGAQTKRLSAALSSILSFGGTGGFTGTGAASVAYEANNSATGTSPITATVNLGTNANRSIGVIWFGAAIPPGLSITIGSDTLSAVGSSNDASTEACGLYATATAQTGNQTLTISWTGGATQTFAWLAVSGADPTNGFSATNFSAQGTAVGTTISNPLNNWLSGDGMVCACYVKGTIVSNTSSGTVITGLSATGTKLCAEYAAGGFSASLSTGGFASFCATIKCANNILIESTGSVAGIATQPFTISLQLGTNANRAVFIAIAGGSGVTGVTSVTINGETLNYIAGGANNCPFLYGGKVTSTGLQTLTVTWSGTSAFIDMAALSRVHQTTPYEQAQTQFVVSDTSLLFTDSNVVPVRDWSLSSYWSVGAASVTGPFSLSGLMSYIQQNDAVTGVDWFFDDGLGGAVDFAATAVVVRNATDTAAGGSNTLTTLKAIGKVLTAVLSFTGAQTKKAATGLTAALSFTGAHVKKIGHALTSAALSFVGAVTGVKSTSGTQFTQSLAAALSFTGAYTLRTAHLMTAAASFVGTALKATSLHQTAAVSFGGTQNKKTAHGEVAALSFGGQFIKKTAKNIAGGTISFAGAVTKSVQAHYSAALIFVGTQSKAVGHLLSAQASFTGAIIRNTATSFTGLLSFMGSHIKRTARSMTASLAFTGAVVASSVRFMVMTAVLSFSGAFAKLPNKTVSGSVSFTGSHVKMAQHGMTAALTFSGAMVKLLFQALMASLGFSGSMVISTKRTLAGALGFVGSLTKQTNKMLNGVLDFLANFSISSSGTNAFTQAFVAGLSFTGSMTRSTMSLQVAVLSFTGVLMKSIKTSLSSALSFAGRLANAFGRNLSAVLSFTGSLSRASIWSKLLSGALSFSGAAPTRQVNKVFTAALTLTGLLVRRTSTALQTAGLGFTGSFFKTAQKALPAGLSFAGVQSGVRLFFRTFPATLTFTGNYVKRTMPLLGSTLHLAGVISVRVGTGLSGRLSFAGGFIKRTIKAITASLSFTGAWSQVRTVVQRFTATLSFTGAVLRNSISKFLPAVLGFTTQMQRRMSVTMSSATLTFAGTISRATRFIRSLTGALSFTGSITSGRIFHLALAGAISFTGTLNKRVLKFLLAGLNFLANLTKKTAKSLSAALTLAGAWYWRGGHLEFEWMVYARQETQTLPTLSLIPQVYAHTKKGDFAITSAKELEYLLTARDDLVGLTILGTYYALRTIDRGDAHSVQAPISVKQDPH